MYAEINPPELEDVGVESVEVEQSSSSSAPIDALTSVSSDVGPPDPTAYCHFHTDHAVVEQPQTLVMLRFPQEQRDRPFVG